MQWEERVVYEFGEFRLDPRRRLLTRSGGERVPLTGKAFDALIYLAERAGEPVTRTTLTDALWPSTVVEDNNLSQAISILRRALGEGLIETISRRGYQFTAEVRVVAANGPAQEQCAPQTAALAQKSSRAPPGVSRLAAPRVALLGSAVAVAAIVGAVWLAQRGGVDAHVDPLDGYVFSTLTEFEGVEEHAAVSRDGQFVAFLRERDGVWEVWVGQVGTGHFLNLTGGTMRELRNPAVRTIGFSPDGSDVLIWTKIGHPDTGGVVDAGWAVPTLGGTPRPYRPGIAELDWSPDGKRIVYHTAAAGDPLYVGDAADRNDDRLIYVAPAGLHSHFPLWSRDGRFIYFVRGVVPDEMDVWRVRAVDPQAEAERLTFHGSRVSFPAMLDDRTLLYLATADDGSGPWIHALDLDRRTSRRLDTRGQAYSSLAASADGSRLVATEVRSTTGLWRMPLSDGMDGAPVRLDVPSAHASSPRFGPRFIAYRAANGDTEGVWKLENGAAIELWSETNGRVVAGPAVAPNGQRLAFCVANAERTELYVMDADGSNARQLAEELDVRGAPAWSPSGRSIAVGAMHDGGPRLFKIPLDGGEPVALTEEYAVDPVWSPSEAFIVFSGADVGTNFSIRAVNADGTPHALPELVLSRGSRRLDFLDEDRLVLLKGSLAHKEVWLVDLRTGQEQQLTELGPGPLIGDFDVSADGLEIVFDRLREESDIVLIERAQARAN